MILSHCEQPSWQSTTPNRLVDQVVEDTEYAPAVGRS